MAEHMSVFERVTGAPLYDQSTVDDLLHTAYNGLAAAPLTAEEFAAEKDRLGNLAAHTGYAALSDGDRERCLDLDSLYGALIGQRECNVMADWHQYARLFSRYGKPMEGGNALLIGSVGALSARAFTRMADSLYGAERSMVIDLRAGPDKASHGTFVYGDALAMPFADASIHLLQTSQLMHTLKGLDDWKGNARRLVDEMGRVAAPGAQVLMTEAYPPAYKDRHASQRHIADMPYFKRFLAEAFRENGFSIAHVDTAKTTYDPDYIFYQQDPLQMPTVPVLVAAEVYARRHA